MPNVTNFCSGDCLGGCQMHNFKNVLSNALTQAIDAYQQLDKPFPSEGVQGPGTSLAPAQPSEDTRVYRCVYVCVCVCVCECVCVSV